MRQVFNNNNVDGVIHLAAESHVVNQTMKLMLKKLIQVLNSNILILGFTFKENCPDVRNTKVGDIYKALQEYNFNNTVFDPWANPVLAP